MFKTNYSSELQEISNLGLEVKQLANMLKDNQISTEDYYSILGIGSYLHNFPNNEARNRFDLGQAIIVLSQILRHVTNSVKTSLRKYYVKSCNILLNKLVTTHNKFC